MSVASTELAAPVPAVAPRPVSPAHDAGSGLRLLPAPPCEPPYDDERPTPGLRAVPARGPAGDPTVGRTSLVTAPTGSAVVLRLVPGGATTDGDAGAVEQDDDSPARTPLAALPASRPFAHALVQRLLEVMAGLRPVSQLQRDTTFELFTELECALPAQRRPAGPRPTRRDVRSVHVQEHEEGVAEVCATVRRGGRVTALALRLEGVDGGWRCTALHGV